VRVAAAGVLLGMLAGTVVVSAGARAEDASEPIVVIANPVFGNIELTRSLVRDAYLGELRYLGNIAIAPISLHERHPVAQAFLDEVMGMSENQFKSWWIKRIFRHGDVPPMRVMDSAEMIARVLATPGGMGYLSQSELPPGVPLTVVWRFTPQPATP